MASPYAGAATKYSKATGNWGTNNTWSLSVCGGAQPNSTTPTAADIAIICGGHTVTVDANSNVAASVTVNSTGTLQVGRANDNSGNTRVLTVSGDVTVNLGGALKATASSGNGAVHSLVIGGDLTNNGTFDMGPGAGTGNPKAAVAVTFNNATGATISGTGSASSAPAGVTRFYRLIVSLGASAANILDYQANDFQFSTSPAGCLLLANGAALITSNANCVGGAANTATNPATGGTFKISRSSGGSIAIAPFDNATMAATPNCLLIGSAAGFWLNSSITTIDVGDANAANANGCNTAAAPLNVSINGSTFRVTAGTVNLTTRPNQRLRLLNSASTKYWQEGGTATVSARLASATAADSAVVQMSGGTLILGADAGGNSDASVANGFFGPFYLGNGASSQFIMSGGTLIIRNKSAAATPAFAYVNGATAANSAVSGGLLQIGDASTTASAQTYELCIGSVTTVGSAPNCVAATGAPLWNLTVDWNKSNSAQLRSGLVINNDLTIGSVSNNSTARLDASAVSLHDVTVGNNISIGTGSTLNSNSRDIAIGSANVTAANGVWTNNGSFTPGTGTVTFNGTSTSQSQAIAGTNATTFNNLTVSKVSAATLFVSKSPTVNGTLTLTAGNVCTGSTATTCTQNKLSLGSAATVSRTGGLTPAAATQTNHIRGNFEKAFSGLGTFTYPVGDGTHYTPLTVTFSTLATAGSLTATTPESPAADHPDTAGGRTGIASTPSVNRYWTLKNSTLAGTYTATLYYLAADLDGGAPTHVARGESCATSGGIRTCNPWGRFTATVSGNSVVNASSLTIVSGDGDADLVAGQTATPRFVREKEFIYTREVY